MFVAARTSSGYAPASNGVATIAEWSQLSEPSVISSEGAPRRSFRSASTWRRGVRRR